MQSDNPSQNGEEALPVIVWEMKTITNILSIYQLLDWILIYMSRLTKDSLILSPHLPEILEESL
jgi:uncharacterized membrane protein